MATRKLKLPKVSKTSKKDLTGLIPEVPMFIYDCMEAPDTPEAALEVQDKANAEAMLTSKPSDDLTQLIPHWPWDTSLLSKFAYRTPTQKEWYMLVDKFHEHKEFVDLIKLYPHTFVLPERLYYRCVTLLAYVTDWKAWNERTRIPDEEYLNNLETFNSVDVNPALEKYKKMYKGDNKILNSVIKQLDTKKGSYHSFPDWLFENPYAITENEKDAWLVKLASYKELAGRYFYARLKPVQARGALPRHLLPADLYLLDSDYDHKEEETCLDLMEKDKTYTESVVSYILSELSTVQYPKGACYYVFLKAASKGWLSDEQVFKFLNHLSNTSIFTVYENLLTHYSHVMKANWQLLAKGNLQNFCSKLPAETLIEYGVPTITLIEALRLTKSEVLITELRKREKEIETSILPSISEEQARTVMEYQLAIIPYKQLNQYLGRHTYGDDKVKFVRLWLSTIKPHMKLKDYQALLLTLVRQDTSLKSLISEKRSNVLKKVLSVAT